LQQGDVRAKLALQGIEVSGSTPEALQAEVVDELAKWTKVMRNANIKAE
jgi:tripartite-type tricarboxylate transporter receptor subunit TctC